MTDESRDPTPEEAVEDARQAEELKDPDHLYNISARVKNLATYGGSNLTPMGVQLCNCYTHVLKELYDFSRTLPDHHKEVLRAILAKNESMPAELISFAMPKRR